VLVALGTAALWADSYRLRPPPPPIPPEILDQGFFLPLSPKKQIENRTGLRWERCNRGTFGHVNRVNYFIRTFKGELGLQRHVGIVTGSYVRPFQWDLAGVRYKNWISLYSQSNWSREEYAVQELSIPIWLVTTLFAAYPIIAFARAIRHSRANRRARLSGFCTNCTYDLTGNVSGRCPECGEAIQESMTPTPSAKHLNE
jgi:hypothetical protein